MTEPLLVSKQLAQFVATTRYEQLPAQTVTATKRCLLDAIGVSLAATTLGDGTNAFIDYATTQGGIASSTIFGKAGKVPAAAAAFANGALAHALDFEDAHDGALVHPNAATVPAALAVAEAIGNISGKELLTAIAIGCDVVCRVGISLRCALDDFGWYPPPILSAFGATAAAAHLHKLDERQVLDAFSLALCQATCSAELKYNPNSVIRAVRDSFAAQTGVLSVALAKRGVTGFDLPFEGKAGFFALFARGRYEPADLVRDLGTRFEIDNISFKPWPTCRGTHVYIELALALVRERGLQIADIACIETVGSRINRMLAEPIASKQAPTTAIDAKFSIPFAVATALVHGSVGLEHFRPQALRSKDVMSLAQRINFTVDAQDDGDPRNMTRGSLTIVTRAGERLSRSGHQPLGHPTNPLSDTALVEKFLSCARHYSRTLTATAAQQLADTVLHMENIDDIAGRLMRLV